MPTRAEQRMAWHRVASALAVALGQQPDSPDGGAAAMCPSCWAGSESGGEAGVPPHS